MFASILQKILKGFLKYQISQVLSDKLRDVWSWSKLRNCPEPAALCEKGPKRPQNPSIYKFSGLQNLQKNDHSFLPFFQFFDFEKNIEERKKLIKEDYTFVWLGC